jgi:hypothetical protein
MSIEDLTQQNPYYFRDFQNTLQNLGYLFSANHLIVDMLRTFLSDDGVNVLFYSQNSIRGHYHALQLKSN